MGHREELQAGREAHRKPSGPAASSIGDDVAAEVGGGAAVASIAPAHIARVDRDAAILYKSYGTSLMLSGLALHSSTSTNNWYSRGPDGEDGSLTHHRDRAKSP